jgi:murein L,D-transpeptidase YafK
MRRSLCLALSLIACDRLPPRPEPSRSPTRSSMTASPLRAPIAAVTSAVVTAAPAPSASVDTGIFGLRKPTEWGADRNLSGPDRMAQAERLRMAAVLQMFADASVSFPPKQLLLRAFKREGELEVWASDRAEGPLSRIATYAICYASGTIGPKRREGDKQVPEGFYRISYFNPKSLFHLAMLVSYPNDSDRVFSDPKQPGGEIMIHGSCVSIGCLAMSDERAEELWLMARATPPPVHVHLFPTRKLDELIASDEAPEHRPFWSNLREGFARFEKSRTIPRVQVAPDGRYRFF